MINLSNLPIILYLIAIPLISSGTTGGNPVLTWLGFGALFIGGAITPGLRFVGEKDYPMSTHSTEQEKKNG